jgi:predicted PurR-regulated permease PerM
MQTWQISCAVVAIGTAALLIFAADVFLVVFAGLLMAVFLHGGGRLIARPLGLATHWGIGAFLLLLLLAFLLVSAFAAAAIADQFEDLVGQLPGAVETLRERLESTAWGNTLLNNINLDGLFSTESRERATAAVTSTFGALGSFVIMLFIGIYVSLDPAPYRRGLLSLLAPSLRPRADEVLRQCADTLKSWLGAQLAAMALIGTLTGLGLWLIGIPLAFILGIIAALLAFIPNIGPILALVPALLLAFPEGTNMVIWVLAIYLSVQALESYIVTPLLQQNAVSLPPAFIISVQFLLGLAFGILGLTLATPLAAVALTLTKELYVRDYLGSDPVSADVTDPAGQA